MAVTSFENPVPFRPRAFPFERTTPNSPLTFRTRILRRDDFTVGWICALKHELAASRAMLDHEYTQDNIEDGDPTDQNIYKWGKIGKHNVVMASLPAGRYGIGAAASVAKDMLRSYRSLRMNLLVGIGGGVRSKKTEMDLGDVVVSMPTETFGGVIQYDLGKVLPNGNFQRRGYLDKPPPILLKAVQSLQSTHDMKGSQITANLDRMMHKFPLMSNQYSWPGTIKTPSPLTSQEQDAIREHAKEPRVHYGLIASGNRVIASVQEREKICQDGNILCIEMEAAGLMDDFKCLVIRGICDFANAEKSDEWQNYAAATAAAYARELLQEIPYSTARELSDAEQDPASYTLTDGYAAGLQLGQVYKLDKSLFVGREADLAAIEDCLLVKPEFPRTAIIAGLGGMGKTQLTLHFATMHQHKYSSIWCLDASSTSSLKKSLVGIAKFASRLQGGQSMSAEGAEDEATILARILRWLSEPANNRWLLVYDNYDDPDLPGIRSPTGYDIREYFPSVVQGSIIITTRSPKVQIGKLIHLKTLPELNLGLEILGRRSRRSGVIEDPGAIRLAKRLNGLPLALAAAGDYLHDCPDTFDQYLESYENAWTEVVATSNLPEYEDRTLHSTWNVSFQRIERVAPEAAQFLRLLAYFDNKDIFYELFLAENKIDTCLSRNDVIDIVPGWFRDITSSRVKFNSAMKKLQDYSFVEIDDEKQSYSMHSCVHDWTLEDLNGQVNEQLFNISVACLASLLPTERIPSYWSVISRLEGHGSRILHYRMRELGVSTEPHDVKIYFSLACMFHDQGKFEGAKRFCINVLERFDEAEYFWQLFVLLGDAQFALGDFDEAEKSLHKAIKIAGSRESDGDDLFYCYNSLGRIYVIRGKWDNAETILVKSLQGCDDAEENNAAKLGALGFLGSLYLMQKRWQEAEAILRRAHAGFQLALECDNASKVPIKTKMLEQREEIFWATLKWTRKLRGCTPETCMIQNNLGELLSQQQRFGEAKELLSHAIEGYREIYGANHMETISSKSNLARLFEKQGQDDDANAIWRTISPECKETLISLYESQGFEQDADAVRRVVAREKAQGG
ncbi:hypothetical protein FH972_024644 [Carpinus fangiana]|uniref:Nucleoside phosphorylase domain-containing protein n=1 Tax=Carpinus fangiana TaxID=176857 RepID=A0A5N6KYX4_9ROSI|nr:hypothetical protein FH972_024644 [Carpinus fangiana]